VKLEIRDHEGKELTGSKMHDCIQSYWTDLSGFLEWPFSAWFDFIRFIPYQSDDARFPARIIELVPRPVYLLDRSLFPRIDCKKKSILVCAWAFGNLFPYRLLAVSTVPSGDVHHVFPQIDFGYGWINADATLPDYSIGQPYPITFAAELRK
jgi:hypothetical protein